MSSQWNPGRKIKIGLIVSLFYTAGFIGLPGAAFSASSIVVKGDVVNVRGAPGIANSIVATVRSGDRFQVLDTRGDWHKIKVNGREGWIAGWLVDENNRPAQPEDSIQKVKQATITASAANVRSGPGTSHGMITTVAKGGKFNVADVSGQWIKIKLPDGKQGWIAGWLAAVDTVTVNNPPPPNNGSMVAVVNGSDVNLRGGPGRGHRVIAQVSRGQRMGVLERSGDWAKVQLEGGVIGWVAGWLINVEQAEASPSPGDPPVQTPDTDQSNEQDGPVEMVRLEKIEISEQDGHTYVTIQAEDQLNYDMFMLTGPERLVLDLKNIDPTDLPEKMRVDTEAVSQLRTGWLTQEPPVVRLVFDLKGTVANVDKLSQDRTRLDLDIFIPQPGSFLHGRVIALDPGHGGSDPGARGPSGLQEKDVNLDIALRLREILTQSGAKVIMTRTQDSYVDLYERTNIAARHNADVFLSIHNNANHCREKNGTSTYYRRDYGDLAPGVNQADNRRLASLVQSEMLRSLGRRSLGVLQANFVVLRTASMPSAMAEVVFISNHEEEQMLRQDMVRQRVAESLAQALNSYFAPTN
ncbi:MAG: N-acetylmuramoyl-L-alanine amidase [Firmicutes bacterium]|nr:N-acetylmuramoyl-L-alanine amidase [Bacillota bacterium]